jgi:hypothetical protein
MLSSAEALRLEIDIARTAAECAGSKDPEKRGRLQARLTALCAKRDPAGGSGTHFRSEFRYVAAVPGSEK